MSKAEFFKEQVFRQVAYSISITDPALLRPGRFDRQVLVDLPELSGREAILKIHAQKVKLGEDVNLKVMDDKGATTEHSNIVSFARMYLAVEISS